MRTGAGSAARDAAGTGSSLHAKKRAHVDGKVKKTSGKKNVCKGGNAKRGKKKSILYSEKPRRTYPSRAGKAARLDHDSGPMVGALRRRSKRNKRSESISRRKREGPKRGLSRPLAGSKRQGCTSSSKFSGKTWKGSCVQRRDT